MRAGMGNVQKHIKYIFVCGLHRSGSTILARSIGKLKNCTSFENTGAIMDEGQFLQDVYPPDDFYGGVGRFGFAPQAHLTERSPLLTHANVMRLRQSWEAYWDRNKTIRIEKTPGNLLMTRFLQAALENAYFVVIKRHPVPVSLATQKWCRLPLHKLFEHWLRCYGTFDNDKKLLNHLYELTYEDYISDPDRHLTAIAAMIGTEPSSTAKEEVADTYNQVYLDRWDQMLLRKSRYRGYYRQVAKRYESQFSPHGYTVVEPLRKTAFLVHEDSASQRAAAASLCMAANIGCRVWRTDLLLRGKLRPFLAQHALTAGLLRSPDGTALRNQETRSAKGNSPR